MNSLKKDYPLGDLSIYAQYNQKQQTQNPIRHNQFNQPQIIFQQRDATFQTKSSIQPQYDGQNKKMIMNSPCTQNQYVTNQQMQFTVDNPNKQQQQNGFEKKFVVGNCNRLSNLGFTSPKTSANTSKNYISSSNTLNINSTNIPIRSNSSNPCHNTIQASLNNNQNNNTNHFYNNTKPTNNTNYTYNNAIYTNNPNSANTTQSTLSPNLISAQLFSPLNSSNVPIISQECNQIHSLEIQSNLMSPIKLLELQAIQQKQPVSDEHSNTFNQQNLNFKTIDLNSPLQNIQTINFPAQQYHEPSSSEIQNQKNNEFQISYQDSLQKQQLENNINLNIKNINEEINCQKFEKTSSLPISDQPTDYTLNQCDDKIIQEYDHIFKKIDQIFLQQDFVQDNNNSPIIQLKSEEEYKTQCKDQDNMKNQNIKIEVLEKQIKDQDIQISESNLKIQALQKEIQNQSYQQQQLTQSLEKFQSENQELKLQISSFEDQQNNVKNEADNLRQNILIYENEVQKLIEQELNARKLLENEKISNQNLQHLVEELEYQLSKQQQTICVNHEQIITGILSEVEVLKQKIEILNKEISCQNESKQKMIIDYEKQIYKLTEERDNFEKTNKATDEKHKKKHSFIQAENSYVLNQLTIMKKDIDDKDEEIKILRLQISSIQSHNDNDNISQKYQNLLDTYKDTCSAYENEICQYKYQLSLLINNCDSQTPSPNIESLNHDILTELVEQSNLICNNDSQHQNEQNQS